ncbi:hypothetical protein BGZ83_001227, partial [Gryganskiella cystojenkinii]
DTKTHQYTKAMIIPFSENQIEDCVSQFVRDSEVHELADEGPTWSTGDYMDKPKSTPFEIPMERKAFLPLEILEKIASYTSGYVCCVLGLGLSSPPIRQCMFLSGGPGRVLSEIFSRGGDPRALFTIKEYVPSDIAIAKAVVTKDKRMLVRTFAIWGTKESVMGRFMAIKADFHDDVGMIDGTPHDDSLCYETMVQYTNAYYLRMGKVDMVDESIYDPYGVYVRSLESPMEITPEVYKRIMGGPGDSCVRTKIRVASKMGALEDILRAVDEEDGGPCDMACFAIASCPPKDALKIYDRYSSSGHDDHNRYVMALLEVFSSSRDLSCLPKDHRMYPMISYLLSLDPSTPCLNALECCHEYHMWDRSGRFISGAVDEYLTTGGPSKTLDYIFRHDQHWRYLSDIQLTRLFLLGKVDRRCIQHIQLTRDLDDRTLVERVSYEVGFRDVDDLLWFYGKFPETPVVAFGNIYEIPGISGGTIYFRRPYKPWDICGETQWILEQVDIYLCLEYYF